MTPQNLTQSLYNNIKFRPKKLLIRGKKHNIQFLFRKKKKKTPTQDVNFPYHYERVYHTPRRSVKQILSSFHVVVRIRTPRNPSYTQTRNENVVYQPRFLSLKTLLSTLPLSSLSMGANSSVLSNPDGPSRPLKLKLDDIPESCVAMVLSCLDPPEICQLARLNRAFRAASSADFIWESKLPPNYRYLVERFLNESSLNLGKKDIFARLSKPISFDGGTKV